MIRILEALEAREEKILDRDGAEASPEIEQAVRELLSDVRSRGDEALRFYTQKFDGAELDSLFVTEEEMAEAEAAADPDFLKSLQLAAKNIRAFHEKQILPDFRMEAENGVVLGQRVLPLSRVGIYVPGGTASYPSTVLMNAIPAKLAGVKDILMATPPDRKGKIAPAILLAAKFAGVTAILKAGGAQAVAAMAYGTESVKRVDKIVGPGNIFVATAKRMVYGLVDIDMIAGPSEILVLADEGANARHLAADLLSQAEHDRLASAVLVTDSRPLAEAVQKEIEAQLQSLPREAIARASVENRSCILLAKDMEEAVALSNRLAPEHLELAVKEPFALLPQIRNAGSVFLGGYSPEALGDYLAGPNHTLPTMGTARFMSPLSVYDFLKRSSYLYYPKEALRAVKDDIARLARQEGLEAHARSALIRFSEE